MRSLIDTLNDTQFNFPLSNSGFLFANDQCFFRIIRQLRYAAQHESIPTNKKHRTAVLVGNNFLIPLLSALKELGINSVIQCDNDQRVLDFTKNMIEAYKRHNNETDFIHSLSATEKNPYYDSNYYKSGDPFLIRLFYERYSLYKQTMGPIDFYGSYEFRQECLNALDHYKDAIIHLHIDLLDTENQEQFGKILKQSETEILVLCVSNLGSKNHDEKGKLSNIIKLWPFSKSPFLSYSDGNRSFPYFKGYFDNADLPRGPFDTTLHSQGPFRNLEEFKLEIAIQNTASGNPLHNLRKTCITRTPLFFRTSHPFKEKRSVSLIDFLIKNSKLFSHSEKKKALEHKPSETPINTP